MLNAPTIWEGSGKATIKDIALNINAPPPSAEQLRMALLEEQMKEADKAVKQQAAANQELTIHR